MRKVTQLTCGAFEAGRACTLGNTHTDGTTLFLHGNAIARRTPQGLEITMAGWETVTTRERLSGLTGVSVSQRKGEQYLNGKKWENCNEWTNVREYANN